MIAPMVLGGGYRRGRGELLSPVWSQAQGVF